MNIAARMFMELSGANSENNNHPPLNHNSTNWRKSVCSEAFAGEVEWQRNFSPTFFAFKGTVMIEYTVYSTMGEDKKSVAPDETVIRVLSEYRTTLFVEARRFYSDAGDAEELVLRTMDAALRTWDSCKSKESPLSWLFGILRNIHSKDVRRLVERNSVATDPEVLAANDQLLTTATEDEILRNSDSEALRDAINRLAPEYKKTVVMHYMMDMPLKEIAKVLHRPIGTVKWRLSVAKDVLAGMLKKTLGRPGTWMILLVGLITGCVATYCIMRLPPRKQSDPTGGIAYNTPKVHEIIVHRAPKEVKIDGDLDEWTAPVFEAACNPPYDRYYRASIRMMWDEKRLYIGGDICTPDPMKNMGLSAGTPLFAGGSVICRIAADSLVPHPLPADTFDWTPERIRGDPCLDDRLASIIITYSLDARRAIVSAHRRNGGCGDKKRIGDVECECLHVEYENRRGYTFECAIEWDKLGLTSPKKGETRPNTWNIHFSDKDGQICTGQIVENVLPNAERCIAPERLPWLFRMPLWGKAVFE